MIFTRCPALIFTLQNVSGIAIGDGAGSKGILGGMFSGAGNRFRHMVHSLPGSTTISCATATDKKRCEKEVAYEHNIESKMMQGVSDVDAMDKLQKLRSHPQVAGLTAPQENEVFQRVATRIGFDVKNYQALAQPSQPAAGFGAAPLLPPLGAVAPPLTVPVAPPTAPVGMPAPVGSPSSLNPPPPPAQPGAVPTYSPAALNPPAPLSAHPTPAPGQASPAAPVAALPPPPPPPSNMGKFLSQKIIDV